MIIHCPVCKKENPDGIKVCDRCKTDISLLLSMDDQAEQSLRESEELIKKKQYGLAINRLLETLELRPGDHSALFLLVEAYHGLNSPENALFYFKQIPEDSSFYIRAKTLLKVSEPAEQVAGKITLRVLAISVLFLVSIYGTFWIATQREVKKSKLISEKLINTTIQKDSIKNVHQGLITDLKTFHDLYQTQKYEITYEKGEEIISKHPEWLATLLKDEVNRVGEAMLFTKLHQVSQLRAVGKTNEALVLLRELRQQKLDNTSRQVFRILRAIGLAYYEKAETAYKQDDFTKAFSLYQHALNLFNPDEYSSIYYLDDVLIRMAFISKNQGKKQESQKYYQLFEKYCSQGQWYARFKSLFSGN